MSKQQVIIIRSFGDQKPMPRSWRLISKLWRHFGAEVHIFTVGWTDNQPYKRKLKRLIEQVDYLSAQGFLVSLVGISAGASMALNAYHARKEKVPKVVFISGKLLDPAGVNPRFYKQNPAFKDSLQMSDKVAKQLTSGDKKKMLYVHGLSDKLIPSSANKPPGIRTKPVIALGHIFSIFVALFFYSHSICKFLSR